MRSLLKRVSKLDRPQRLTEQVQEDLYHDLSLIGESIRVLNLHSGTDQEALHCKLSTIDLTGNTSAPYETISYAWGDPRSTSRIYINDHMVKVPANTFQALRSVRLQDQDRIVWIDFLSINQDDLDERNRQVALMSLVYRRSMGNLIYLGDDTAKATQAFAAIELIAAEAEAAMNKAGLDIHELLFPGGYFSFSDRPLSCTPDFVALAWLYQLSWFRRLWVLQEAVLSPQNTAICGNAIIEFSRIELATAWLEHKTFVIVRPDLTITNLPGFRGANNMWLLRKEMLRGYFAMPFAALLGFSPFGEASDVRDQVFGLLGLYLATSAAHEIPAPLQPDYRKSVADALRDATRFAIGEEQRLAVLERLPLKRPERPERLPSWVSEWWRNHAPGDPRALTNSALACGNTKHWHTTEMLWSPDPNVLRIKGIKVDVIVIAGDAIRGPENTYAHLLLQRLVSWHGMSCNAGVSVDVLGITLLGGKWWTDAEATSEHGVLVERLLQHLHKSNTIPSAPSMLSDTISVEEKEVAGFMTVLRSACFARSFFVTAGGRVGIGPSDLQAGDVLGVLQGGRLPFILRMNGESTQCQILGPAYVHGIMHGEALTEEDRPIVFEIS